MFKRLIAVSLGLSLLGASTTAYAQQAQSSGSPWDASWRYLEQNAPGSQSVLVHALGGQDQLEEALAQLEDILSTGLEQGFPSAQALAEGIICLAKLEQDPTSYHRENLVSALSSYANVHQEGLQGPYSALNAYRTAGVEVDTSARNDESSLIDYLVSSQQREGGFAPSPGRDPSIQTTANVLIALAPYADIPYVDSAMERALDWLGRNQNEDGSFSSGNTPSCAVTAAVLTAIRTCGLPADDPRFLKEGGGLSQALERFAQPDGGYGETLEGPSEVAATEAALVALLTDASGLSPYLPPASYPGYVPPEPLPTASTSWIIWLAAGAAILLVVGLAALFAVRAHRRTTSAPETSNIPLADTQTLDFQIPMKAQMPDFEQLPPTQDPPSPRDES